MESIAKIIKKANMSVKIKIGLTETLSDETIWLEADSFLGIGLSQAVSIVM